MAIKTISAPPAAIAVGAIPYGDGTSTLAYLPAGAAHQTLKLGATGTVPTWGYAGSRLLYAGTVAADVVISNIPAGYNDIVVKMWTDAQTGGNNLQDFVTSAGTAVVNNVAGFGIDLDSSFTSLTIEGSLSGGITTFPGTGEPMWQPNSAAAGSYAEITILDYSNASGIATRYKPAKWLAHTAPGTTAAHGFTIGQGEIDVTTGTNTITGLTVNIVANTVLYVYVVS